MTSEPVTATDPVQVGERWVYWIGTESCSLPTLEAALESRERRLWAIREYHSRGLNPYQRRRMEECDDRTPDNLPM